MELDWKSLPSLSALRAFDLLARKGSFAEAARALYVTHAAIAQQVRALESDLGISLARRAGRKVALTEDGAQLAREMGEGFDKIAAAIQHARDRTAARPLQISATIFIAQSLVLPRLDEFWRRHPEVPVSVAPTQELVDLAIGGFDLAIRASLGEPDWPDAKAELLLESPVIAVGAPSLVTPDMSPLDQMPWVWSEGVAHEERSLRAFGIDPAATRNADLGAPFLQLNIVRSGLGLTFAPEVIVAEDLAAGTLRRVPVPSPFSLGYYAAIPKGTLRPQARLFINWLKTEATRERRPLEGPSA